MRAFRQVLLEPLRAAVLPLLVLCGCPSSSREASDDAGASSTSNVRLLETHRGATSLWHDNGLWVSAKADWDRPATIRLSRGAAAVHHETRGWVAGMHGGRVIVARVDGGELSFDALDASGEGRRLGTAPRLPDGKNYAMAVNSAGEVVLVDEVHALVRVLGSDGLRALPGAVEPGDTVWSLAADPGSSRVAVVLHQTRGTPRIDRRPRLLIIDTNTEAIQRHELDGGLSASEGEVAFDEDGRVWLHFDDRFLNYGEQPPSARLPGAFIRARTMALAPDAATVAWSETHGGGHMSPLSSSSSCTVHRVAMDDTAPSTKPVQRFDRRCDFGVGLAFVGGTLWVAPP